MRFIIVVFSIPLRIFQWLLLLMVLAMSLSAVAVPAHHPAAAALALRTMSVPLLMGGMLVRRVGALGLRLARVLGPRRLVLSTGLRRLRRRDGRDQEEGAGDNCSTDLHVSNSQFQLHRRFIP